MNELAPWRDFAGNEIYNGDVICHPSGERGKVVFLPNESDPGGPMARGLRRRQLSIAALPANR